MPFDLYDAYSLFEFLYVLLFGMLLFLNTYLEGVIAAAVGGLFWFSESLKSVEELFGLKIDGRLAAGWVF